MEFAEAPFSQEVLDFHKAKMEERDKVEKRAVNFKMVADDIYTIRKGLFSGKIEIKPK